MLIGAGAAVSIGSLGSPPPPLEGDEDRNIVKELC